MYMGHYGKKKYFKVDDVRDKPIRGVITAVELDQKYDHPVITLDHVGKLSLNGTNTDVLNLSYGFDDQDWIGAEIELYVGLTRFKGEDCDSVLIKPISPAKPGATRTPRRSIRKSGDNMDDEIPF
jgi:hypothetical protein